MKLKPTIPFASLILLASAGVAQTPPAANPAPKPAAAASTPAPAKPAATKSAAKPAPKAVTQVDSIVALLKAKTSEALIMKTIHQAVVLSQTDMVKLKEAGASDNLVLYLMDPTASAAPAAAPVVAATPVQTPAPAAVTPPSAAPVAAYTPTPAPVDLNAQKKRVAVDAFDYSAVMTTVQAVFRTNQDIGKGIQSMMVTRLAKDNKVIVVDRSKLKQVLAEQDMTAGNRVKQGSGARIGRVSGADAILAGDIIIFGRDDKKTGAGAAAGVATVGRFCTFCGFVGGALSASKTEEKAVVAIDYRLIDAETTEVIATGEARGESLRKSKDFMGAFAKAYSGGGAAKFDMTSSNFAETIIGEATQDCVNKLTKALDEQTTTMKKRVREVDATVADVQGNSLMISAGSGEGVNVGEVFEILEAIREVKDPTTGELLDRVTEKRGEMVITSVRDKISLGNYTGASPAKVKFIARKKLPVQQ